MHKPKNTLQGARIVVSGIDLEQSVHRGIANYSKSLINALNGAGAKIWILTEFDPTLPPDICKALPKDSKELIYCGRVLEQLAADTANNQIAMNIEANDKLQATKKWTEAAKKIFKQISRQLNVKSNYTKSDIHIIDIRKYDRNPYFYHKRLSYISHIDGLLCAKNIYRNSMLAAKYKNSTVQIDLDEFDGFITTCPLNIKAKNTKFTLQTIHDIIPLEYPPMNENPIIFANRLRECEKTRKIFVSVATKKKFQTHISTLPNGKDLVIIQPPSLIFSQKIMPTRNFIEIHNAIGSNKETEILIPYRYILFNSTLEPRKNVEFAIRAYQASTLPGRGIRFCIAGELMKSSYSFNIQSMVIKDKNIILTDYIDDDLRKKLFLNATALISPSLVEGFGIPVLDAACLGLIAIVSNLDSHHEIQNLYDFKKFVWTSEIDHASKMANLMNLAAKKLAMPKTVKSIHRSSSNRLLRLLHIKQIQSEEAMRIRRYEYYQKLMQGEFQEKLESTIRIYD